MLNGKDLRDCTDSELAEALSDTSSAPHGLDHAIVAEIALRRRARAAYQYGRTDVVGNEA